MQTVGRVVAVLERLGETPAGMTLSEVARATGLPAATCHRLLFALEEAGFVARAPDGRRWQLGPAIVRLANGSFAPPTTA